MTVTTATTSPRKHGRDAAPTSAHDQQAGTTPERTRKTVAKVVPVDKIDRDPTQPRKHFGQTELNELALSLKELGQLQPISVRYNPATKRYILIMGERRWRAAKIAGLTELHCLVMHGIADGDPETLAKAVAENVGRADMTPIEEANGFKRLVDFGYDVEKVAAMCGKSAAYVSWRIDLLKLTLPVQEALMKGHIPVGVAWYVANLAPDNQTRFLGRWARGDFATTRDAEAFAQACRAEEERQASQGSMFILADTGSAPRPGPAGNQDGLFAELDVPSEERERLASERRTLIAKIDRLGSAGAILAEIAAMDPAELALLLAGAPGGIHAHKMRVEHLKDVAIKAMKTLREAQAVVSVRAGALQVAPGAVSDSSTAPAENVDASAA